MSKLIDADALEKDGWTMNRIVQVDTNTMEYQTKKPTDFPTIEPEPKWTQVSERLPEEDGEYLVLYHIQSKYKPYVYDVRLFANDLYKIDEYDFYDKKGQKGWVYYDREYGFCEDDSVIAWMPLPEPYKGEGGNE